MAWRWEQTQTGSSRASRHSPTNQLQRRPLHVLLVVGLLVRPQSLARQDDVAQQARQHAIERVGRAQAEQRDAARIQHALHLEQAGGLAVPCQVPDAVAGEYDGIELVLVVEGAHGVADAEARVDSAAAAAARASSIIDGEMSMPSTR